MSAELLTECARFENGASHHRRIRVLHMGSPTGLYGAERWILALIKHLPPDHIESRIGVIRDDPALKAPLCTEAEKSGFRVQIFESMGKLSLSAIGSLRRYIQKNRIDVLHTHGYKTDIIGLLAVRGTACRIVATPHGWSVNAGLMLQLYERLDRLCFLFVDTVAPLSADIHRSLRRIPTLKRRLHLIENGVDLSEVDAPSAIPEPVRSWRANDQFVIGYIGQLITRKRIDTLIEAFHRLDLSEKRLCIIGEGPQRCELEQLSARLGESDRVSFLGFREDRIALLKGFDLFVLPSELEGIPRCLMEAMGAGIPVIASDIPGCRDLVTPGTGILFRPGDSADLAHRMTPVIADPGLRADLANQGSRRVHVCYSAEVMAKQYAGLYGRLAGKTENPVGPARKTCD